MLITENKLLKIVIFQTKVLQFIVHKRKSKQLF